jgi:hypothetical protein
MVTLTTGTMFLVFTCMHFWIMSNLPIAYEVVRDCRMFSETPIYMTVYR